MRVAASHPEAPFRKAGLLLRPIGSKVGTPPNANFPGRQEAATSQFFFFPSNHSRLFSHLSPLLKTIDIGLSQLANRPS
ncbi:hypothetical protein TgHK011_005449 [Trichoderma gracile]|nr:hypothetical protein TgHK011_005449 [Trichoderma gracile]